VAGWLTLRVPIRTTLDSVNEKGKEAWVKAGNDVSTYVDVAKASLPDYFATIDKSIAETQTHMGNIAAIVLALGPEYADAAGQLGTDILQGIVDGMNNGNMDPLNTFKSEVDRGGKDAMDLINQNIANATPEIMAEWMKLTGGTEQAFRDAMTKSGKSLAEIMDEARKQADIPIVPKVNTAPVKGQFDDMHAYAEAMQIWLHAQGDTFPARTDFANEREYQDGVKLWMHAYGDTIPARKDFFDAKSYGEALTTWLHANGETKPAREMFLSAKQYGDGLHAWIKANADTYQAEQDLARVANKQRYAYIQTQLVNPGGRPVNPGMFGGATGGYFGPNGFERGFAGGGYTGDGHKYQPKGIVHGGEFVFDQVSTGALGRTFLSNLMASAKNGYSSGGAVSSANYAATGASQRSIRMASPSISIVELSPADRELLREAGNLQVIIPGEHIASATRASNRRQAGRGAS
jgi:hypothetical protein